jgi:hypothetical protein
MIDIPELIQKSITTDWKTYERRKGLFQIITPCKYADGDMVEVYAEISPDYEGQIRISDLGMTYMRYDPFEWRITRSSEKEILYTKKVYGRTIYLYNKKGELYCNAYPTYLILNIKCFINIIKEIERESKNAF